MVKKVGKESTLFCLDSFKSHSTLNISYAKQFNYWPLPGRVFSLNFWWGGTQNFPSPSVPDGDEVGWGGDLWKKSNWSQNCPLNAKLGHFCYFKHEIQLFNVLLSLKVVKFDTKMYLNFSNFRGRTSAGGEQALVQKRGQVSDGGDW